MASALQVRRLSRSRLPAISPSLRRSAPSPTPAHEAEERPSPPGSPSILGPPEAPLLPAEDEDEDEEGIWEAVRPTVSPPAARRPVRRGAIASPSLRRRPATPPATSGGSGGAHSPTLFAGVRPAHAHPPNAGVARVVRVKDRVVPFKRAPCKRASRAARPSEPSANAAQVCAEIVRRREGELKGEGRTKLAADDVAKYRATAVSGKGPSAHARLEEEQAKINHIAQLKAKNVETHNQAASWLLWGNTAEQCYDQLAESALRSNAVNSAIAKKKEKQGAAYQTSRIWCKGIGAAAAAQCGNVAIAFGLAEAMLRAAGVDVRAPLATNAVDPCVFAEASWMRALEPDDAGGRRLDHAARLQRQPDQGGRGLHHGGGAQAGAPRAEPAQDDQRGDGLVQLHARRHVQVGGRRL